MERAGWRERARRKRPARDGADWLLQPFLGRDKLGEIGDDTMEIVEGGSGYKSTELDCPRGKLAGGLRPYSEDEMGGEGEPVELLRNDLSDSLKKGDVVEIAGYPESRDEKHVRVVRDGKVIATAHYLRVSDGWLGGLTENCAGF